MTTLQIDYMFVFDIDNTVAQLLDDRYDYAIVEELPDWWAHPQEKKHALEMVTRIDNMVAALRYDIGDTDDEYIS